MSIYEYSLPITQRIECYQTLMHLDKQITFPNILSSVILQYLKSSVCTELSALTSGIL